MANPRAVARLYAETLLQVAEKHGGLDAAEDAAAWLDALADAAADPKVRAFLRAPTIEADAKRAALEAAVPGAPAWFGAFLRLLALKGRLAALPDLARTFRRLVEARRGRQPVELVFTAPPDEGSVETLRRRLEERLGHPVAPIVRIDPRVLGGVVVRVGDRRWDASVRRRLQELRRRLQTAAASAPGAR